MEKLPLKEGTTLHSVSQQHFLEHRYFVIQFPQKKVTTGFITSSQWYLHCKKPWAREKAGQETCSLQMQKTWRSAPPQKYTLKDAKRKKSKFKTVGRTSRISLCCHFNKNRRRKSESSYIQPESILFEIGWRHQLLFFLILRASIFNGSPDLAFLPSLVWTSRLWQCHDIHARDLAIRRRTDGPILRRLQGHQKAKTWRSPKGKSKITKMEPETGSCRTSNRTKFLLLWTTRFTHPRVFQNFLRPAKVNRKCSIRGAMIGRADQRDQVDQTNSPVRAHLLNQENHGEVVGNVIGGSIPKIRWKQQPETGALDGTWHTLFGVDDTSHVLLQLFVVSASCLDRNMSKRPREMPDEPVTAKPKPVRGLRQMNTCSGSEAKGWSQRVV